MTSTSVNQPADILNSSCPSRTVLRHLTDRWTPMIVTVLATGEQVRFKTLKEKVQGISPKVLTETLRSMQRDGLLRREVTASIPPRVDYQLTDLGMSIVEPLSTLRCWAETHVDEVIAHREAYDRGVN
ncbi:predicted transcriptional regulator [Corynebacterium kutscheri]|uniref:Predicted transcriptional regulator n=1 Tax=Corynebacterium kutscheri TaxID=35755 RepID=A0A0F6R255_9CORY|nr:helix-turn-helix domain-containing protein [Corynebacterium kutscheri]AKE41408.1 transcriptional regulator, HxlR family [Corynebacterium kutscheri]VEH08685.1 predicted transcriptional regulator [Corynebacterium kutscheri]VEH09732.1 predicted transcriptional regulator [Corynebacterium kutscheri]VEH79815.1 predicted transcriptional regulator [Corynebacterium kutscheri]